MPVATRALLYLQGFCAADYMVYMCISFEVGLDVDANKLSCADTFKLLAIDGYFLELLKALLPR